MTAHAKGTVSAVPDARSVAIAYAEHDWPIFPLYEVRANGRCGCGNFDCNSPGKHPASTGWQNTIASVPAARSAWRGYLARRGIGMACGERARMWVLDADAKTGGLTALARL